MLIAGETSGDLLAAELVGALKAEFANAAHARLSTPQFFGAGGPGMAAAGVELSFDMTEFAVVGLVEVLKNYGKFKRLFDALLQLAIKRRPQAIICVDFSGFNRRFAAAIRRHERRHPELNWHPKIIQYVSPQVWASRPKRAEKMARDIDLLLAILPFEKEWYAKRVPGLRVEFVGHPIVDRHAQAQRQIQAQERTTLSSGEGPDAISAVVLGPRVASNSQDSFPSVLLLPGSRVGELRRHLPVMLEALEMILSSQPNLEMRMVLPSKHLAELARSFSAPAGLHVQVGGLPEALATATVAIASTGTVTLECAYFRVPTVAIYKTSWSTYWLGRSLIQVRYLAMPNLLAQETLFPEFIQHAATAQNIAHAALELVKDPDRRRQIEGKLASVTRPLGQPGANTRAARAIIQLLSSKSGPNLRSAAVG